MYLSLPDPASQTTSSPLSFTLSTAPQRRPGCRPGRGDHLGPRRVLLTSSRAAESPSALIVQHRAAARVSTSARARASLRGVGVCARRRDRPSRALRRSFPPVPRLAATATIVAFLFERAAPRLSRSCGSRGRGSTVSRPAAEPHARQLPRDAPRASPIDGCRPRAPHMAVSDSPPLPRNAATA